MANFEITQEGQRLKLLVKLDKENLETLANAKTEELSDLPVSVGFVQAYLDAHFKLSVNKQMVQFDLIQLSNDKDNYTVELLTTKAIYKTINEVELENTCLIDLVEKHSNIVHFNINEGTRSFRLHKARTSINLSY